MNPSALQGTGVDHDFLRGKKINQYQSIAFILQICNFGTQLIVQIYYNLLLYRQECFTEKYATSKIHAKLYAAIEWRFLTVGSLTLSRRSAMEERKPGTGRSIGGER